MHSIHSQLIYFSFDPLFFPQLSSLNYIFLFIHLFIFILCKDTILPIRNDFFCIQFSVNFYWPYTWEFNGLQYVDDLVTIYFKICSMVRSKVRTPFILFTFTFTSKIGFMLIKCVFAFICLLVTIQIYACVFSLLSLFCNLLKNYSLCYCMMMMLLL